MYSFGLRLSAVIFVCLTMAVACLIPRATLYAQSAQLPHVAMGLRYTGAGRWVVYLNSTDFNFQRKAVADFPTQEAADEARSRLNEALPFPSSYFYEMELVSSAAPLPPQVESGLVPNRKTPAGNSASENSLAGKTAAGKIGDYNVQISFGEGGSLSIAGQANAKGRWSQDGATVYLETDAFTYRGTITGDVIYGLRFSRKRGVPVTEWRVTLRRARHFAGTTWFYSDGVQTTVTSLLEGNIVRVSGSGGDKVGTWQATGDTVAIKYRSGEYTVSLVGTLSGNTISGSARLLGASGRPEKFRDAKTREIVTSKSVTLIRRK